MASVYISMGNSLGTLQAHDFRSTLFQCWSNVTYLETTLIKRHVPSGSSKYYCACVPAMFQISKNDRQKPFVLSCQYEAGKTVLSKTCLHHITVHAVTMNICFLKWSLSVMLYTSDQWYLWRPKLGKILPNVFEYEYEYSAWCIYSWIQIPHFSKVFK